MYLFIYLAALGLCCCAWAFSSCGEQGLLFIAVRGLLIAVASLVAEHWFQVHGVQQLWLVGSRAQAQQLWHTGLVLHGTWDLPRPGLEPVCPELAGGFLTTAPPGKSQMRKFEHTFSIKIKHSTPEKLLFFLVEVH